MVAFEKDETRVVCSEAMFADHLARWNLTPDGDPIITSTSRLLPVRSDNAPAMLKLALVDDEKRGGRLMKWWEGQGAARILAHDDGAILMERARADLSLVEFVRGGRDDEASLIICAVTARLHTLRLQPPPDLIALADWFEPLRSAARTHAGILRLAAVVAAELLVQPREVTVLHGDIHHRNVLDFGARGWLAIDPKGLVGERYFDYANLFCNPDAATTTKTGRLTRQINVVSAAADLEPTRLRAWIVAWAGLSAAFSLEDGLTAEPVLKLAELAAAELHG